MDTSFFEIYTVRNFLEADACGDLITEMRRSPDEPALTYGKSASGSVDDGVRKVARIMPSSETVTYVMRRLMEHREKIEEHFGIMLTSCEAPQFLRYRVGDFFVAHQDGNTGMLRLDTESRRVSVSIFLNDQSEQPDTDTYCGGSLVFTDWRQGREHRVVGESGTLVAFRSEVTHEVTPVTQGERYSIVSWYR